MRSLARKFINSLPVLIIIIGVITAILSFGADLLGVGGKPGFGTKQVFLLLAGIIFIVSGLILLMPRTRRYFREWRAPRSVFEGHTPILIIAIWFGLISGLIEVSILGYRKLILNVIITYGINIVWMAPLVYIIFFAIIGLFLILVDKLRFFTVSLKLTVLIFSFLTSFGILLLFSRISQFASFILGLGLAVQIARIVVAHTNGFYFIVFHTLGWPGVIRFAGNREIPAADQSETQGSISRREFLFSSGIFIGALALGATGADFLNEQSRVDKIPKINKDLPNIILITLDTVRAKDLSIYGYDRKTTPRLEQLVPNSILFERAFSNAPWTLASHASIFTGHYPHQLSVGWGSPLDNTYQTLAEALSKKGYMTAGFIANTIYCSYEWGLSRGFAHYEDYQVSLGQAVRSASLPHFLVESQAFRDSFNYYNILGRKTAEQLSNEFLRWTSESHQPPFFAFLNYFDAHDPYMPPKPYLDIFGSGVHRENPMFNNVTTWVWTAQQIQAELDAYDGAIAYIDHHLGRVLDELKAQGILDNTLLIITSDHGEHFGEHGGLMGHGQSLYSQELHVPLLISYPALLPAGIRVSEAVSLRDLAATIFDLLGMDAEVVFPGNSLSPYWGNKNAANNRINQPILSEVNHLPVGKLQKQAPLIHGDMKSLIADGLHYIKNGDGNEELYDLENDLDETLNLSHESKYGSQLKLFRNMLEQLLNG